MNAEASADLHRSYLAAPLVGGCEGAGRACVNLAAARSWCSSSALGAVPPPLGASSRLRQLLVAGAQADANQRLWGRQRR